VGMWGGSYVGATQMAAAMASPPHLAGIFPGLIASNAHEQWVYQGGAFAQLLNQAWSTALSINTLERRASRDAQPSHWDMKRPPALYPMLDVGTAAGLADYYYDWLAHPNYDDYWKAVSIEEHFSQIQVPALHLGGWYDYFQDGTVRNYLGIKSKGGTEIARKGQRLVMMVGGHAGAGPKVGEVDFGSNSVLDTWALGFRWYDYILKGIENGMAQEKPVRIFVMGKNVWREEEEWPLARAKETRYYLHSAGKANTLTGDGALSTAAPGTEPADRYVYDPADPTPTKGGPAFGDSHQTPGAFDQRSVESRSDVLVYSTPPMTKEMEVTGPVSLELWISSSGVDTDFTGKLVDVAPDGLAQNLSEGILRARYRNSREKPELMNPGETYRITVELFSTSNVFLPGHRLRVEVSSSNFPRFERNLNTGAEETSTSAQALKALNVVYHDREHASALLLPVVP
jgi:putative CocE/NonD family hydrolase